MQTYSSVLPRKTLRNPTTGITRTSTTEDNFDADDNNDANAMKLNSTGIKNGWDPFNYLNIWVCDLTNSSGGGTTLGYVLPVDYWLALDLMLGRMA